MGLNPSWGPSTLWTYLNFFFFFTLSGPSTLWTMVLTLRGVRPLCGHLSFLPLSGPSTLWTGVLTISGVRPLCGLFTVVESVHVVDYGLDPPWGPSTLWILIFLPLSGPSTLWTGVLTFGGVHPLCGLFSVGVRPLCGLV